MGLRRGFSRRPCWRSRLRAAPGRSRRRLLRRRAAAGTPATEEYNQQFLVPGSWFHGVHGLAFNKDDQLFAGSVVGQTIYRVQVDSGEVDRLVEPPIGMADDIAFADDGTMAWTAFLLGKVYIRRGNKTIEVANGMAGPNSLAFGKDGRLFVSEVFLGDALYEIDIKNVDKPEFKSIARNDLRRIAEKLGGLNGFEINKDDGFLYGPLWFKGQVGQDQRRHRRHRGDRLGLQDAGRRQHRSADPRRSLRHRHRQRRGVEASASPARPRGWSPTLKPGLDNLAFDSRGRLFVTSMTDNGIYLVDKRDRRGQDHRRGQARDPGRPRGRDRRTARIRCMSPTSSAIARSTAATAR